MRRLFFLLTTLAPLAAVPAAWASQAFRIVAPIQPIVFAKPTPIAALNSLILPMSGSPVSPSLNLTAAAGVIDPPVVKLVQETLHQIPWTPEYVGKWEGDEPLGVGTASESGVSNQFNNPSALFDNARPRSEDATPNWTANDQDWLQRYQSDLYARLNYYNRFLAPDRERIAKKRLPFWRRTKKGIEKRIEELFGKSERMSAQIDSAIDKLPIFKGTVLRGMSMGLDEAKILEESLRNPAGYVEPAIMSTSRSIKNALQFMNMHKDEKRYLLVIETSNGRRPPSSQEQEILFKRNTRFEILTRVEKNDSVGPITVIFLASH